MISLKKLLVAAFAGLALRAAAANPPLAIGYVTKSATNQGWTLINSGAADAARDGGVQLIIGGPSAQGELAGQIDAIERVARRGAKVIAVAPVDSGGITPVVRRVTAEGIPFVAVDTNIDGNLAKSYVATDNLVAAAAQAEWAAGQVGDTDQIILVDGSLTESTGRDRRQGFLDRIKQLKPKVTVIEVHTSWMFDQAQTGIEAAMRALGYQKGRMRIIGFDGAPNALALLRDGWIQADVAQMLYREGYEGIKAAIAVARGEAVPARIDTGYTLVTSGTLDHFISEAKLAQWMR